MNTNEPVQDPSHTDDVDTLAKNADQRRERIGETLDLLGGRLSPERMKEQAFDLFTNHGSDLAEGLRRSAKANPVPLILTGVGIAWMMMSQRDEQQARRSDQYRQYPEFRQPPMDTRHIPAQSALKDRVGESGSDGDSLTDKAGDAKDRLVGGVSDGWGTVSDRARDVQDATGERLEAMRERSAEMSGQLQQQYRSATHEAGRMTDQWSRDASRFMQEQPLVAGALGIALGALLGGLVPTSDKERELAGKAVNSDMGREAVKKSEEMLKGVKAKADEQIEKAGQVAESKLDDVKERTRTEA